jgi:hypothetical protein
MRSFATFFCGFAVFFAGGCAEVTDPPGVPVDWTITAWPGAAVPLEGVELCDTNRANCVTTDAAGKATLRLPVSETSFTEEKDGFGPYLVPLVVPEEGLAHDSGMGTDIFLETLYEDVMSPYPMGDMGRISIGTVPAFAGVTLELSDANGPIADPKAYYVLNTAPPSWSLEATETATSGGGGFLEVSPGEYVVQFGGTAINCIPVPTGWPAPFVPNSIRVPVRAGFITQATATCEQAP